MLLVNIWSSAVLDCPPVLYMVVGCDDVYYVYPVSENLLVDMWHEDFGNYSAIF